ncbi:beta-1,4-N-acetylgalactosaminyltransferase bre-4-like [Haliotis cracherodii]|uniref:beta-1,4-N-acetylgalactosaminyltransferase bre-4-like n=1 Tax=Haliotis cracherodii TaxID=6455 RepID=UPI0039E91413
MFTIFSIMIPHKASLRICVCLALLFIYFECKHLGLTVGSNSARSVSTYSLHSSKSLLSQWSNISKGASSMKTLPDSFNGDDTVPNLCPQVPPNLVGNITARMEALPFEELERRFAELKPGGRFTPPDCKSRHRVAIIVAYRDRESHLKVLLNNLHPMLQRQQLDYGIYVVEQALPGIFNKAMLNNIGYTEAMKEYDYQCFFFHDVDHIPENDKNLYTCPKNPRHVAVAIDKHQYKLFYQGAFGGVIALTKEHMNTVNGFSNRYYGWGMEDDDMFRRLKHSGLKITRASKIFARYRTIKHSRDKTNPVNKDRFRLIRQVSKDMETDGLNSLRYDLLKKEYKKLYTWVYAQVGEKRFLPHESNGQV